ncbi:sigma-70 family RNA polymerase sigma factor [Streptomyces sp. B1I3]|uniref:sigma-70 family RNA polymerase sigma factor n=1 Tax=Streptomyces sp. B1I3 TaxID=3042264 RepID=UPI0027883CE9|nr:sigma-70 family RNA polymerase sigma factor [Streptomyces sp. B1I3]MDQ0792288.1 RNA polymerase sigma factor (sigma-70 family) [Streptomyces sp. B1I3]
MGEARETTLVKAAQKGDQRAQDRLVASYLPLVYNIVGRALDGHADVDDVVQESVLRMLRGLPALRTPGSFRSWFVAITMNQLREHWRERGSGEMSTIRMHEAHDVVDHRADFVELTLLRLGLTGQRREVAEATRWLDEDDRALLSLWWLETAGELTRAEVTCALELTAQHTAVRVQRMKAQLEAARVVVRALAAHPRCVLLEDLTTQWDGTPSALWRKRLSRHARGCTVCSGYRSGLVPAESLLVGLALVPVAASAAGRADAISVAGVGRSAAPGRAERRRGEARRRRRTTVVAGVLAVAALGGGGGAVHLYTDGGNEERSTAAGGPAAPTTAPVPPPVRTPVPPSSAPRSSASASPSPSAARSRSASPTRGTVPRPRTPTPAPPAAPAPGPASPAPSTASSPTDEEVVRLVNAERAKAGCEPVGTSGALATAASRHSADMVARDYFSHTSPDGTDPGDRITAAGYRWSTYGENIAKGQTTAASVMDAWMNSPGHRANILNCAFEEIGIGRQESPSGPVWTQAFGAAL